MTAKLVLTFTQTDKDNVEMSTTPDDNTQATEYEKKLHDYILSSLLTFFEQVNNSEDYAYLN